MLDDIDDDAVVVVRRFGEEQLRDIATAVKRGEGRLEDARSKLFACGTRYGPVLSVMAGKNVARAERHREADLLAVDMKRRIREFR